MQDIGTVVFDIGNVLIPFDPEGWYRRRLGPARMQELFDTVDLHGMNLDIDRGAGLAERVNAEALRHPDWATEIRFWHHHWLEFLGPALSGSVTILRALRRRGVPVWALSNFGKDTFEMARPVYPFLNEFDRSFISGHLRMIKPDPGIYAALEAACPHPPEQLLFVDDRPENITAATERGWQGHLFDGADGWRNRIVATGLLSEEDLT